jgi:hypothetical protein
MPVEVLLVERLFSHIINCGVGAHDYLNFVKFVNGLGCCLYPKAISEAQLAKADFSLSLAMLPWGISCPK